MKKHVSFACLALLATATTYASTIIWSGATTIAGDTDIITQGRTVFAYTGGSAATVNGVPFTFTLEQAINNKNIQLAGFKDNEASTFTSTSNSFASLSADYKKIIQGAVTNPGTMATVTLKYLSVGRDYIVQLWVNDPRAGVSTNRYAIVDGTGPTLYYNATRAVGGVGAYAVGTFTADAETQSFTLAGSGSTQLNAIQLRVQPVPLQDLYWDTNSDTAGFGSAGGVWGADSNWSTNALGATAPDQQLSTTHSNVLHLGTTTTGLAAGTIHLNGTQSFDTLVFGLASDPITITNGALKLATLASTLVLNNTTNTIASPLAAGGGLTVRSVRPLLCDGFPSTTERVLFANATLADYTGATVKMAGSSIASSSTIPTPGFVYFWVNDGTNASFQAQTYEGGHTKVVKMALRQVGANITGKALYAKHCSPDGNKLGNNFDNEGAGSSVASWFNVGGYGIAELKLLPYDDRFVQYRFSQFLSTNAQTIATAANLKEFTTAECYLAGLSVTDNVQPASTFYFVNDGATATFQAQCNDGVYTKCVKVELTQVGNDIKARPIYAKHIIGNFPGHNFDVSGNNNSIAADITARDYGVRSIRLTKGQATLALTADSEFDGPVNLTAATLKLDGLLGNGVMGGEIINNGTIQCRPPKLQQFSGAISGTGSFTVNGMSGTPIFYNETLTTESRVVAQNCTLADIVTVNGLFSTRSMSNGPVAGAPYFFANDGTTATVQIQIHNGGHTKAVKVEFKQTGADIYAKVLYAKHCSEPHGNNLGTNYDNTGIDYDYQLQRLTLYTAPPVLLSGNSTYTGGTVVNSGWLEVTAVSSLPTAGGIVVNGGNLTLNASPNATTYSAVGGTNNSITVFSGGCLTLWQDFNAGYARPITLDGGMLENNADNYVNNLVLKNGPQFAGIKPIRVGYVSNARVVVAGTSPSTLNKGLILVNNGRTLTLDVANVTGDDAIDLAVTGALVDLDGYTGLPIIKIGAGTMTLSAANSFSGPITVNAGTIALDADNALNSNNIQLNNGTLEMGAFNNTAGTLAVSGANSVLVLGSGTIAFADSSATTWGNKLTLSGTLVEGSVRFGSNSSALTAAQLGAIDYSGERRVRLNSAGYLTAKPTGALIILR